MSKSTKIIITAAFLCVLGLIGGLIFEHYISSYDKVSDPGDFVVQDASGKNVALSDLKGKPVLINFAASWCTYCKQEMPDIQKAYEKYGDDVQFMIIDAVGQSGETKAKFVKLIKTGGYTFPVYYDNKQSALEAFAVTSYPQTYFINKNGKLVDQTLGATNFSDLETQIKALL